MEALLQSQFPDLIPSSDKDMQVVDPSAEPATDLAPRLQPDLDYTDVELQEKPALEQAIEPGMCRIYSLLIPSKQSSHYDSL